MNVDGLRCRGLSRRLCLTYVLLLLDNVRSNLFACLPGRKNCSFLVFFDFFFDFFFPSDMNTSWRQYLPTLSIRACWIPTLCT